MAPRFKGGSAHFAMALDGVTPVEISGSTRGLDSITLAEIEDTRTVPGGGGQDIEQRLGYKEGSASLTVDENSTTRPVLWGRHGRVFDCVYGPEGGASGDPRFSWSAYAEITHSFEARGVRRFTVALSNQGLITEGTFA